MRYLLGMSGYMRQTLQMYENGYTLERLVGLQTLMQQVGLGGAAGADVLSSHRSEALIVFMQGVGT